MNSIEIRNFKNFRHLAVGGLGRLNLIVGKNNAGKSSLLEAISIIASGADYEWIRQILEQHGLYFHAGSDGGSSVETENLVSLYHNRDSEAFRSDPITLKSETSADGTVLTSEITMKLGEIGRIYEAAQDGSEVIRHCVVTDENRSAIDPLSIRTALIVERDNGQSRYTHYFGTYGNRQQSLDSKVPFRYVRTVDLNTDANALLFDRIALTPLEPVLITALHVIDDRIRAINFLKDDSVRSPRAERRVPFVVLDGSYEKYRLSTIGDGINRVLTIVLALLNCRGGILLVDEFENGLHYSVQESLWRLISKLASELNVQVFATTHSQDCISGFLKATAGSENGRLIRLEELDLLNG